MRYQLILLSVLLCPFLAGCVAGPYAQNGAVVGGLIGAPIGAMVGADNGRAGTGAIVGGALGALTGSNIGAGMDLDAQAASFQQDQRQRLVSMQEVINLTRSGLGDDVIINQIYAAGLTRPPTANELISLKNAGVSDRVIAAMQNVAPRVRPAIRSAPVIVEEHFWRPRPYDCGPPPRHFRYHRPPRRRVGSSISFHHRF